MIVSKLGKYLSTRAISANLPQKILRFLLSCFLWSWTTHEELGSIAEAHVKKDVKSSFLEAATRGAL